MGCWTAAAAGGDGGDGGGTGEGAGAAAGRGDGLLTVHRARCGGGRGVAADRVGANGDSVVADRLASAQIPLEADLDVIAFALDGCLALHMGCSRLDQLGAGRCRASAGDGGV